MVAAPVARAPPDATAWNSQPEATLAVQAKRQPGCSGVGSRHPSIVVPLLLGSQSQMPAPGKVAIGRPVVGDPRCCCVSRSDSWSTLQVDEQMKLLRQGTRTPADRPMHGCRCGSPASSRARALAHSGSTKTTQHDDLPMLWGVHAACWLLPSLFSAVTSLQRVHPTHHLHTLSQRHKAALPGSGRSPWRPSYWGGCVSGCCAGGDACCSLG